MLSSYFEDPNWKVDPLGAVLINIANPAAGNNFIQAVPANTRWIPISLRFVLTTSGVAGNRIVSIRADDGANIFAQTFETTNLTPGTAWQVSFGVQSPAFTVAAFVSAPLPQGIVLLPTYRIGSATNAIDAGDQYSAIYMQVIRQTHL